jgi:hypothetical protein
MTGAPTWTIASSFVLMHLALIDVPANSMVELCLFGNAFD